MDLRKLNSIPSFYDFDLKYCNGEWNLIFESSNRMIFKILFFFFMSICNFVNPSMEKSLNQKWYDSFEWEWKIAKIIYLLVFLIN